MNRRIREKILATREKPNFYKVVTKKYFDKNNHTIFKLECGHSVLVNDPKYMTRDKLFCSRCVQKFLIEKNKEINESIKHPFKATLKPK